MNLDKEVPMIPYKQWMLIGSIISTNPIKMLDKYKLDNQNAKK
jgi:hypothetical protein